MRIIKTLACLLLASLSACATIVEGSTDTINLSTTPPTNSTCSLVNKRGTFSTYTGAAVSPVTVSKSRSDLDVTCVDPRSGARGQSKIISDVEPWAFGNILLGGLIGLGIDWSTGAAYDYPDSATVPMGIETMPVDQNAVQYQQPQSYNSAPGTPAQQPAAAAVAAQPPVAAPQPQPQAQQGNYDPNATYVGQPVSAPAPLPATQAQPNYTAPVAPRAQYQYR